MKNRGFLKKLGDFALGKGFYIVLFLCVATIGISGYYLLQTTVDNTGLTAQTGGDASVTVPDQSVTHPATPVTPVTPSEDEDPAPARTEQEEPESALQPDDPEPVTRPTAEPEEDEQVSDVFTWPVKGAVLRDFSIETLSLDPTMGDWRTHSGLDIAAAQGVQVLSISAGTVDQIYEDSLMGTTVVVDHGGGLQSRYSNLAAETAVQVGDPVNIGSVLGTVGGTAIAEVGMESHLHLETTLDGQLVDPGEYLPEQQ